MRSRRPVLRVVRHLAGLALAAALGAAPAAVQAETIFSAVLDGPTSGSTSPSTGTATLILNDAQTEADYVIEYTSLTGSETGAHFHYGIPGGLGPRLLTLPPGSPKIGTWAVDAFDLGELLAGRVYVNVHSTTFPSGEIRGNFETFTVAAEPSSFGALKAIYR